MKIDKLSNENFAELLIISGVTSTSWGLMTQLLHSKKEKDREEILEYIKIHSEHVYNKLTSQETIKIINAIIEISQKLN